MKQIQVKKAFTISMIFLLLFFGIAFWVESGQSQGFDMLLCRAIYGARNEALTVCFTAITYIGNWQTVSLLCLFLLIWKKTRVAYGVPVSIAAVTSSVLYKGMKWIFARPRPGIEFRLIEESGLSFPSGHSMTSLVFYGLLLILLLQGQARKKTAYGLTAFFCCLIFLIGCSRIYLGVHYPTDVLGGFCLGSALLFFFLWSYGRAYKTSIKEDAL